MGSRVCSGGGLECAGLLWLFCSVLLLSLTGAGRASVGHPWGTSGTGGHGLRAPASAALLLQLPVLCTLSEVLCCREWGFSDAI